MSPVRVFQLFHGVLINQIGDNVVLVVRYLINALIFLFRLVDKLMNTFDAGTLP